jgi:plastocyanin
LATPPQKQGRSFAADFPRASGIHDKLTGGAFDFTGRMISGGVASTCEERTGSPLWSKSGDSGLAPEARNPKLAVAKMSIEKKSEPTDPLLVVVALLLVLALGTTFYLSIAGPAKVSVVEPAVRQRPVIKEETRVVLVTKEVAGAPAEGGVAAAEKEAKPAKAEAAATPAPAPAPAAAAVAAAPVVTPNSDGKIKGRVVLKGTPAPERPIGAAKSDANCGKSYGDSTPMSRNYVVGADGGLKNVLVRVVSAPAGAGSPQPAPVLDQKGCFYEPYVAAVMVGQTFKVRNSDPFLHNVNATAKANTGFNFAQATQGQENEKVFTKPEVFVKFQCNVHPWMFAFLAVVENPFYTVTDENGKFTLPDGLPPGTYSVEAQHLKAGVAKAEVTVGAGKGADVEFQLAVP